jgi:phosphoenolpyruvate carboxylase
MCRALDRSWDEEERLKWLLSELTGKRPLLPPGLQTTPEVAETLSTFRILAELPPDSLGAYVISMAHTASDVLAVVLLQVLAPSTCLPFHVSSPHACSVRLDHLQKSRHALLHACLVMESRLLLRQCRMPQYACHLV